MGRLIRELGARDPGATGLVAAGVGVECGAQGCEVFRLPWL